MNAEELTKLEALLNEATKGPWQECGHARGGCICGQVWSTNDDCLVLLPDHSGDVPTPDREHVIANARLVAQLRNAAPALIALARRALELEEEIESLKYECMGEDV